MAAAAAAVVTVDGRDVSNSIAKIIRPPLIGGGLVYIQAILKLQPYEVTSE